MSLLMPKVCLKKGICKLLPLNKFSIQSWLRNIDSIIFAADGVLWQGDNALAGAAATFNALHGMGKNVFICTNHPATTCHKLGLKAKSLGFIVGEHQIMGSSMALARYLQERKFSHKVYLVGEQDIADELLSVGIQSVGIREQTMPVLATSSPQHQQHMELVDDVGAVVVGIDGNFNIMKIAQACCYLSDRRVLFLATNRDATQHVAPGRHAPGAGVMVAAIQAATQRKVFTCGKPNPNMCLHLIRKGIIKPERTLLVGDTLSTDVQFGYNCGFQTLLVGTGFNSLEDVRAAQNSDNPFKYQHVPDLYVAKLADLLKFLPSRNG